MAIKSAQEIAHILKEIINLEFGGKERGRFQISRSKLRALSARKRIGDSFVFELTEACFENGLVFIDIGDFYAVLECPTMHNYRRVPTNIIKKYIPQSSIDKNKFEDIY